MGKRVQTAPEGQEGLKAPQVHRPVVSPLKEDAAPGGLPQKSSPERAAEYSKICFFLLALFQSLFLFCTCTRGYGDFQPPILRAVFLRHLQCLCPLGLFNIPLMKNFSVKKEYLPELDLFPIQYFAYNRQHYKNLTKEFFQKSIFSCSNIAKIPVFYKIMG